MIFLLFLFICGIGCALGIAFLATAIVLKKSNLYGSDIETCPEMKRFTCKEATR